MKLFFINWVLLSGIASLAWILYLIKKNPAIIDFFWPIMLTFSGFFFVYEKNNLAGVIASFVLLAWGLRLSTYLFFTRIKKGFIDKRYENLSSNWRMNKIIGFWLNYQLQAILALIISSSFYFVSEIKENLDFHFFIGLFISIVGIIGETIADNQLEICKKENPGSLCKTGLWLWSRHPNYFFEFLVWLGFSISAIHSLPSSFSLISPILLLFIFLKITGPITEKNSVLHKGEIYREYQKNTPMFFLRKPK